MNAVYISVPSTPLPATEKTARNTLSDIDGTLKLMILKNESRDFQSSSLTDKRKENEKFIDNND